MEWVFRAFSPLVFYWPGTQASDLGYSVTVPGALAVKWKPAEEAGVGELRLPDYEECVLDAPAQPLIEMPTEALARNVYRVVEVEGPVHLEEVTVRLREAWQLGRAGQRVQEAIAHAIQFLADRAWIVCRGDFLSLPHREVRARNRASVKSASLRKVERISPDEIAAALLLAVETYHGVEDGEASTTVARLLGMARTTQEFDAAVLEGVRSHVEAGTLVARDGFLREAKFLG